MIRQQKMTDDQQPMMTHVLKTGKTKLLGESKANHTTKPAQDKEDFRQGNNLLTKKPSSSSGGDEKTP
jgi:hypothetical protein